MIHCTVLYLTVRLAAISPRTAQARANVSLREGNSRSGNSMSFVGAAVCNDSADGNADHGNNIEDDITTTPTITAIAAPKSAPISIDWDTEVAQATVEYPATTHLMRHGVVTRPVPTHPE